MCRLSRRAKINAPSLYPDFNKCIPPQSRKDDNNDKSSAKAKSKVRKENEIQKRTQSMEEAQKGMLDIATELRDVPSQECVKSTPHIDLKLFMAPIYPSLTSLAG